MPYLILPALALCALAAGAAASTSASDDDGPSGKELFTSSTPACSICHTLEDAGAAGRVGPDLDSLRPTAEQVRNALFDGPGAMPAYGDKLSEDEIDAVAEYVAEAAGG